MSFSLTTPQILAHTKTVTRRVGWTFLKPSDRLCAIEKGQGLKKGETVKRIATIEVVSVRVEPLNAITQEDVAREGFRMMSPAEFVEMFCRTHTIPDTRRGPPKYLYRPPFPMLPNDDVTRIEFRYIDESTR